MKCPTIETWDLLAVEALDADQAAAMHAHATTCPQCRAQLQAARRAHIDRLRRYETLDCDHDRLREELMANLPASLPAPRRGLLARMGERIMQMNRPTSRRIAAVLLPAACIVIAGILLLSPSSQKSAFAAAVARLREARTIVAHFEAYMNNGTAPMQQGTLYMSDEFGMRFESQGNAGGLPMALPDDVPNVMSMSMTHKPGGPLVLLQPGLKMAIRMNMPDGKMTGWSGGFDQSSPDQFLKSFARLTGDADARLGQSELDGRAVEGFAVSAQKLGLEYVGRDGAAANGEQSGQAKLWVDARSHLPVRMELQMAVDAPPLGTMQVRAVYDKFEFDRPLDGALFETSIPEDYRAFDVNVPAPTEETLIAGLKYFADTMGRYPSSLDPSRMGAELMVGIARSGKIKVDPNDPSSVMNQEMMETVMRVTMGTAFVQQLARDGREPEYFGDMVTPEDKSDMLIRWRELNGQLRVVYGDLHVTTVSD